MCGAIFRRVDYCGVCDDPDPSVCSNHKVPSTASGSDNPGQPSEERQDDGLVHRHAELPEAGEQPKATEGLPRQDGRAGEVGRMSLEKTVITYYVGQYIRGTVCNGALTSLEIYQGDDNWARVYMAPRFLEAELGSLVAILNLEGIVK